MGGQSWKVSGVANSFDLVQPLSWLGCGCLEYCVEKDPKDSSRLSGRGLYMITNAFHRGGSVTRV